jgi:hypothetical protein
MKNATIVLTALCGALFLFSCKKDSGSSGNSSISRPKTYNETITSAVFGNSNTTYDLTYDANGRVTMLADASGGGLKFVYVYGSNNSYTMDLYESNVLSIHEVLYINSSLSLLDSTFQYNNTNDSTTEKYFYNANKQLVKLNTYDYSKATGGALSNTDVYTYDNAGNMLKDENDNDGVTLYTYGNLKNPLSLGQIYHPVNPNLSQTTVFNATGNPISEAQTYTFDSNNRLTSEKDVLSNGDVYVRTYTY